jgi:hypothetical protein
MSPVAGAAAFAATRRLSAGGPRRVYDMARRHAAAAAAAIGFRVGFWAWVSGDFLDRRNGKIVWGRTARMPDEEREKRGSYIVCQGEAIA